jgi:hypothetical protein
MSRKPNFVNISRKLYITTYVLFIFSGEIKLPQKRSLGPEWYHAVTTTSESRERANMLRYAYTASLVRFVERRAVFSIFAVTGVLSVKTLRLYGLILLYNGDSATKTIDITAGRLVSSCSKKQVYVSF